MHAIGRSDLLAPLIAGVVVSGFTFLGGTLALGAHPSWAIKVGLIGTAVGAATWLVQHCFGATGRTMLVFDAVLFVACAAVVWFGKTRFVGTYAQDVLAGRLWFFGWMALTGSAFILVAAMLSSRRDGSA